MAETTYTTNNPHRPEVNLDFTDMLLKFDVDDAVAVSTWKGFLFLFETRHFNPSDQRSERVASQFQQGQQRWKVLDYQKCSTVVCHFQQVSFVLLVCLAQGHTGFFDGSYTDFFHPQTSRQGLANFHQRRQSSLRLAHQRFGHRRLRQADVFGLLWLHDCLFRVLVASIARIIQPRHGIEIRVYRVELHSPKDFIILVAIPQETANHAVKVP
mmetsp:Transcript_5466/g.11181  ORF Transcript_5466/g.11181 Transcript_5466/m.11181 type:complete len:212 (-) Transcript_5466:1317-1952(-)